MKHLVAFTAFVLTLCACGASKLTVQDNTDLSVFAAEIGLCNAQPDPASCKVTVKESFDAKEAAKFDGGFTPATALEGGAL